MGNNDKRPKIRFKGFNDDWEQHKLGDLANIVGGGTPSTNMDKYWDGNINWFSPIEVGNQIYKISSQRKITEEGYNHSSAKMLPIGTILFTSRAGIGKTAILEEEGCTNQGFQSIVPNKDKLDSYFIFSRTNELKEYGEKVGAGSTFVEVSGKQMADMNLMIPKRIEEQIIIGKYFSNIDNLISLHQRKLEKLGNIKKSMLEKMFPKDENKVPEIRFKGFNDDWEQHKVSKEVYSVDTGKSKYNILEIGKYEILGSTGIIGYDDSYDYEGDFLLTARVGANAGTLYRHSGKVKITDNTVFLQGNHIDFVFYLLDKFDLKKLSFGSGQPLIKASELKAIELYIPKNSEEKNKITKYFISIDKLISLHQRKLEKLKNIKKACLEKMFV